MSTDAGSDGAPGEVPLLTQTWRISPGVALRPEPFGALAYHFGNRRLSFLKRRELVEVVEAFDGTATVRDAFVTAGVPESQWTSFLGALAMLASADMIRPAHP